jgi:hypothetical protein
MHDAERQKKYGEGKLDRQARPEGGPENAEPELCGGDLIVHANTQR